MDDKCMAAQLTKKGKPKKIKPFCEIHHLTMDLLVKSNHKAKIKAKLKLNLCPVLNQSTKTYESIYPIYNNDGKHYLPSFTLQQDTDYYRNFEDKYRLDHENKILEEGSEKSELFLPKPNGKSKYCGVCRDNYQDYYQHIHQTDHKAELKKNKFNRYILQMCESQQHSLMSIYHTDGVTIQINPQEHDNKLEETIFLQQSTWDL